LTIGAWYSVSDLFLAYCFEQCNGFFSGVFDLLSVDESAGMVHVGVRYEGIFRVPNASDRIQRKSMPFSINMNPICPAYSHHFLHRKGNLQSIKRLLLHKFNFLRWNGVLRRRNWTLRGNWQANIDRYSRSQRPDL